VAGDDDAKDWLAGVFDRAAPTYDELAGAYHDHFGERLVAIAGVVPGERVLDVGCGRAAVVLPAAARVGDAGPDVVGVDLSSEMVRLATERVASVGARVDLRVGDAENLDVGAGSFDVVLCGFGVFFLPDPERAVAGFYRALVSGGRVGLSTWGAEDERWAWEDELLADVDVGRRAVQRSFDRPADLEGLLRGAGFVDVSVRPEHHVVRLVDDNEWWAWKWSYSLRGLLEQLPPQRLERLRREASQHITAMSAKGPLEVRLEALIATARRP